MNAIQSKVWRQRDHGHSKLSWLESEHIFSFNRFYSEDRRPEINLCVLNDDIIYPSTGFGKHGHKHMEIFSIVLEGELGHEDSTGGQQVLRPGDIQYMSAGTGVIHSEMNPNNSIPTRLLQLWFLPKTHTPSDKDQLLAKYSNLIYSTKSPSKNWFNQHNQWHTLINCLASYPGEEGLNESVDLGIRQHFKMSMISSDQELQTTYKSHSKSRSIFIYNVNGRASANLITSEEDKNEQNELSDKDVLIFSKHEDYDKEILINFNLKQSTTGNRILVIEQ